MIYARIAIYQALKHPWKQSGMPEPAIFKVKIVNRLSSYAPINISPDYIPPTRGRVGIWRGLAIYSCQCPCTGAHLNGYY